MEGGAVEGHDEQERLYAFCSALFSTTDFATASSLFSVECARLGIDGFACGEVFLGERPQTLLLRTDWPAEWLDFYVDEKLFESDPLFERLRRSCSVFSWDNTWDTLGRGTRWRDAVTSFGWRSGLVVPIARGNNRVGLISLASMGAVPSPRDQALLATIARVFYERLRTLASGAPPPTLPCLTRREIECLQHVAAGRDDGDIALRLGIATSTAHEHVERAKRKLGARTRAQGVGVAVGLGIIAS